MTHFVYNSAAGGTTAFGELSYTSAQNEKLVAEHVQDYIANLFPLDAQLQNWADKITMNQVFVEFPMDTYSTISRTNAAYSGSGLTTVQIEGVVPSDPTATYPVKLRAVAELHVDSFGATGTGRMVTQYGIRDRFTYEALKTTRKQVNDLEMQFWWGQGTTPAGGVVSAFDGTVAGTGITGGGTFPRGTQGLVPGVARSGLTRTKNAAPPSVTAATGEIITANYQTHCYDANNINLDRGMLEFSLLEPWWTIGGEPDGCVIFCSPKVKSLFSTIALTAQGPINERKVDAASKLVIDTIDAYETQFGIHYVNKSRYLNLTSNTASLKYRLAGAEATVTTAMDEVMIATMPRYLKIGVFRPMGYSPLAKTGDLDRGMMSTEQAFAMIHPIGAAGIINCVA